MKTLWELVWSVIGVVGLVFSWAIVAAGRIDLLVIIGVYVIWVQATLILLPAALEYWRERRKAA